MVCATSCICGTHSLMWKTRDQRTDWFSFTISCKGSCLHSAHYNVLLLLNVLKINVDNEVFGFLKAFHICALHCQIWTQELLSFPLSFFCSNHKRTCHAIFKSCDSEFIKHLPNIFISENSVELGYFASESLSLPLVFILAVQCTFRNLYEHYLSHNWVRSYNDSGNSSSTLPPLQKMSSMEDFYVAKLGFIQDQMNNYLCEVKAWYWW